MEGIYDGSIRNSTVQNCLPAICRFVLSAVALPPLTRILPDEVTRTTRRTGSASADGERSPH
ncbi:hypothetical protein EJB05_46197, partial [Eragrostis curvula]